ncbi:uncharacterized protein LOC122942110 [Bufo gargarizans]|uniref:uncharacterized protein LOC122942110 n=1 Tax=Bufo gargarizans TaxID=30331 RepID=UPI001CF2E68C|nr:uncharacterized protein LOC122942110 [Bufo gargarizans]
MECGSSPCLSCCSTSSGGSCPTVCEVEALLAQLRVAAESRGSRWQQATVQGLLPGSGEATASALPSSRPWRTSPPARLSPEVTPRVRRRLRSPSVAPPALAALSTSSSRQSRAGRNPVVRRDPRRGVLDLPLSSDAGSVGSRAGSAGGSGPGLSARRVTGRQTASAGRRGPVCGPELVSLLEQRSAGFRSTLDNEGRATSGGRAADLQALGAPSRTRVTSGGEAEVLQALGSTSAVRETSSGAAAGLQAAGSADSRDVTEQMWASGREFVASQVSVPHVPAGGVTASAQPGSWLVWNSEVTAGGNGENRSMMGTDLAHVPSGVQGLANAQKEWLEEEFKIAFIM